ncbi:MAG: helix-turn-helix domain-containing protein [Bacteroidaceae bacterium]|nr:helix-turn-helix domain-containing protein [Bacteroidaceae bacterium]
MKAILNNILRIIPAIVLFFTCHNLCGQGKNYDNETTNIISNQNGLLGENVNRIFRDSRDLIWIATNSNIECYNGSTLFHFVFDDTITTEVNDIAQDKYGDIILATDNGVYKANMSTLTCTHIYKEIEDANRLCIANGTLFAGTSKGLAICDKNGKAKIIGVENNVLSSGNIVLDLKTDGKNDIWTCTRTKIILFGQDGKIKKTEVLTDILESGTITCLEKYKDTIYIGTTVAGLLTYNIRTGKFDKIEGINPHFIRDLNITDDNYMFVSGNSSYIINLQTKNIQTVKATYTFWHDNRFNVDWKGFFLNGMSHNYNVGNYIKVYKFKELDTSQLNVRSFWRHGDDMLIGTREGMYYVNEKKDIIRYYSPDLLGAHIITNIKWFAGQFVFTTYENGIYSFSTSTLEHKLLSKEKGNFSTLAINGDSTKLYASSNLGIMVFDRQLNLINQFSHKNSELPDSYIPEIFIDKDGKGWISTMKQMCLLDPTTNTIAAHGFPEGFFNNKGILSFNQCDNGDVYAFVNSTVYQSKSDLSAFQTYDLSPVLANASINFIFSIDNKCWVGSNSGLFIFDKNFNKYIHFSEADNLPSLNFNKQQIQLTDDGTLWMGNARGLIYITAHDRKSIQDNVAGHVIIDKLLIDDRRQSPGVILDLTNNKEIGLNWNFKQERLTFVPLMLNYSKAHGRYYEYAIDGQKYASAIEGTEISIDELFVGNHHLTIRLAGHPETETLFILKVRPSALFYFELAFVLLLIFTFILLYHLRKKFIVRKNRLHIKHQLERELAAQRAVRELQEKQERERQAYAQAQEEARQQRTSTKEYRELQHKVKQYMELEHPYRNPNFRLSDLAKATDSNPTMISLMLNQNLDTNFYDFVAKYRLDEFKRRVNEDRYKGLTITAISEMCGFKRSTFFAAFKKFEGCTPNDWMKKNGK